MQFILWFIAGASAGYLAGLALFEDEGVGVWGHIVLGALGGVAGGLASAIALGVRDPASTFDPVTIAIAAVLSAVAVVVVNALAERRELGV